ncbi:sulfotransferase [Sphingomonas radiodurans]|uniref:sulfotransferase n=1 Tax=Sphingomonas radiodurans TaxID=2890321 RepID=UPI001E5B049C|nr:sulfotransferase [Sphingomonas radiodurans]WBH16838.1 sulfotransferase [Sphingomonas radiodurans]
MTQPSEEHDGLRVPVGIILYVNRSGSTLLSRIIADVLADVFVFPELRFTLDLLVARRARRRIPTDTLISLMLADPRLASLGLSNAQIATAAKRHGADDLHPLLTALATAALGRRPAALILKLEPYVAFVPELDAAFDTPLLIHALRDLRAVARSMRATPVPEKPGFDMARGSLLYAARHWRNHCRRIEAIAAHRPMITARYETLADPVPAAVRMIVEALGVPLADGSGTRFTVAPIDAALHRNINAPFDPERDTQWRDDLKPSEIALIETICGAEMARAGYRTTADPLSRPALLLAQPIHLRALASHTARTVLTYARRRGGIRQLISRLRLARSTGEL